MVTHRTRRRVPATTALALLLGAAALAACSTGDGRDLDVRAPVSTQPPTATSSTPPAPVTVDTSPTLPGEPVEATAPPADGAVATFDTVPEVGVPGLDAGDAFCAAWSRFGGSFQVIAVAAAFGEESDESVARLEVLASNTVDVAHDEMGELWPDELDSERTEALDRQYGPFAARVGGIVELLAAEGAGDDEFVALDAIWFDVLATRDPNAAAPEIDLPADLGELVERAAAAHLASAGSWFDDASLASGADTPLTDAYLTANCPDQGTLGGQDADG